MSDAATPVLTVQLEGDEPINIPTDNRDLVRWDLTRGKRGWPKSTDAPMLWVTYIAWSAMRRLGHTTLDFDAFNDACIRAEVVSETEPDPTTAPSEG